MPRQSRIKTKKRGWKKLLLPLLLIAGSALFLFSNGQIEGKWQNPQLGQEATSLVQEEIEKQVPDFLNISLTDRQILKDPQILLTVTGQKAQLDFTLTLDKSALINQGLTNNDLTAQISQQAAELGLPLEEILSQIEGQIQTSALTDQLDQSLEAALEKSGANYDRESGHISLAILEGEVNPLLHLITIRKINPTALSYLGQIEVKEGDVIPFWQGQKQVIIPGNDKLRFEKVE